MDWPRVSASLAPDPAVWDVPALRTLTWQGPWVHSDPTRPLKAWPGWGWAAEGWLKLGREEDRWERNARGGPPPCLSPGLRQGWPHGLNKTRVLGSSPHFATDFQEPRGKSLDLSGPSWPPTGLSCDNTDGKDGLEAKAQVASPP